MNNIHGYNLHMYNFHIFNLQLYNPHICNQRKCNSCRFFFVSSDFTASRKRKPMRRRMKKTMVNFWHNLWIIHPSIRARMRPGRFAGVVDIVLENNTKFIIWYVLTVVSTLWMRILSTNTTNNIIAQFCVIFARRLC